MKVPKMPSEYHPHLAIAVFLHYIPYQNLGRREMNESFVFASRQHSPLPLWLYLAGTTHRDPEYRIERPRIPYYVLEAVRSGRGRLLVDGVEFHPAAGDCYLLPLHAECRYASDPDDPWEKHWFNFSGLLVPELLRSYRLNDTVLFPGLHMADRFSEMLRKLESAPLERRQTLFAGVLTELLADISDRVHTPTGGMKPPSPEGIILRDLLEKHLGAPSPPLNLLARKIGRSEAQMLRIFRRDFGISPIAFLLEKKIEQAVLLLRNSSLSVKEIAAMLGFRDEFYFSRTFRDRTGLSPRDFRARDRDDNP